MGIDQKSPAITAKIAHFPDPAREKISRIRDMIHDLAAGLDGVGAIEESLKWGGTGLAPDIGIGHHHSCRLEGKDTRSGDDLPGLQN